MMVEAKTNALSPQPTAHSSPTHLGRISLSCNHYSTTLYDSRVKSSRLNVYLCSCRAAAYTAMCGKDHAIHVNITPLMPVYE